MSQSILLRISFEAFSQLFGFLYVLHQTRHCFATEARIKAIFHILLSYDYWTTTKRLRALV